jgi:hypothetical protein
VNLEPVMNRLRAACNAKDVAMWESLGRWLVVKTLQTAMSICSFVSANRSVLSNLSRSEDTFKEILGRNVDLATESSLHPLIRKNVLADLQVIYEK